jgi:putative transposase
VSNYHRLKIQGGTYFFTVVTEQRQAILTQPNMRIALREAIEQVRLTRPFNIEAWVLLPDHLHAIWTLPEGDDDFSTRWKIIKQLVTRQCGAEFFDATLLNNRRKHKRQSTLWQQRFYERLIRDESDFETHLNYIHFNPVKHGLVECVKDWQYSSFHRYVKQGVYHESWGGEGAAGMNARPTNDPK